MALASAVSEGTLAVCEPTNGFLCTGNSSEPEDLHRQLLSTSMPRPQRGPAFDSS